jgi:hypothetical protein
MEDLMSEAAQPETAGDPRRLDFESAQVLSTRSMPPEHSLHVTGTMPYSNMQVRLVPVQEYFQQPDYWEIEVTGALDGVGLPAETPYSVSSPLNGSVGSVGVEVVGANRRLRIDVLQPPE